MELNLKKNKVFIDDADWRRLSKEKWRVVPRKHLLYCARDFGNRQISMHREILGVTDSRVSIDHIDGNGLNNRRDNLRICTSKQNRQNCRSFHGTSKYKGVSLNRCGKWKAKIGMDDGSIYLGLFDIEEEAAIAYNEAAKKHFGEFARLNEIDVVRYAEALRKKESVIVQHLNEVRQKVVNLIYQ